MNKQLIDNPVITHQLAHRSIRKFTREPISVDLLKTLIRCGQGAPTSSFIQAYTVIRVTRPEVRQLIAAAAGGQVWIEQAAEFLVYCADLRRVEHACVEQGMGELEGYTEHSLAAIVDVALMAQNVLLAAESVGLGGVFIGGIRNDPQLIVDQLILPQLVVPVFGMCLGWPAHSPGVKPRMDLDLVLHEDTYRDMTKEEAGEYDRTMGDYYRSRGSNIKTSDWSAATASAIQGKKRIHMFDFLRRQGFFLE